MRILSAAEVRSTLRKRFFQRDGRDLRIKHAP